MIPGEGTLEQKCFKSCSFFLNLSTEIMDDGLASRVTQAPLDVVADDTGGAFELLLHCPGKWGKSTLTNTNTFCHFLRSIIRPILARLHGPFYLSHY